MLVLLLLFLNPTGRLSYFWSRRDSASFFMYVGDCLRFLGGGGKGLPLGG